MRPKVAHALADGLSLVRIPLAAVIWIAPHDARFVLAIVAIASLSDLVDGAVARRAADGAEGGAGPWLDPLCDKIFVVSAAVAVSLAFAAPWWFLPLLVVRDVITTLLVPVFYLAGGRDAFRSHDYRARPSGKVTTVLQVAAMAALVLWPAAAPPLAVVTAVVGAVAVIERIALARRHVRASATAGTAAAASR